MRNKTKFKLATLWIKFGLVALGLVALVAGVVGLSKIELTKETKTYESWINGMYTGEHTMTETKGEGLFLVVLVLLGILVSTVVVIATRKNLIDFEGHYTPLREGSRRRKITFGLSVLLGWFGIDRLSMGCILRGLLKFLLGFFIFLFFFEELAGNMEGVPLFFNILLLCPLVYWWSVDVILIGMGVAKKRHGEYLA